MTRKKHCHVCGSEQLRGRRKNREVKHSKDKKKFFKNIFRSKRLTGVFALTVFVLIAVSSIAIPFASRAQFQGVLFLKSVNIFQYDQDYDKLEIFMEVSQGRVSIKYIHLYSVDRLIHYDTSDFDMEYGQYRNFVHTFFIFKEEPLLNDGIVLHIEFKYKDQWITHLF